MKKLLFIYLLVFLSHAKSQSQEWMTSFEAAKSLAYVQDKLLFVVWEDASYDQYPVLIKNEQGVNVVEDLFANETVNEIIWEHFVPLILSEQKYETLYNDIKDKRSQAYIDKFNDDSIKIMDINGNIVNTNVNGYGYLNIAKFIVTYALDTSYLKAELGNYRTQQGFNTAYRLASKYIDFAVLVNDDIKPEIIKLSTYYLNEADDFLKDEPSEVFEQKIELQQIKQFLVLGKAKKVLRQLKRIDASEVDVSNEPMVAFLYFTSYILLNDEINASAWRSKVSLVNLKKANLIIKNNS